MKDQNTTKIDLHSSLKLRVIADLHYGENSFDEMAFIEAADTAVAEGRKIVFLGDIITCITPTDRRFEISDHKITFADQLDWLDRTIKTYRDHIHAIFKGNHEDKLIKEHGDFIEKICDKYGVPYFGYQINVLYKKGGKTLNIYYTHGNTSFNYRAGEDRRKKTNKEVRIKDMLNPICEADIYIMGHAHVGILSTSPFDIRLVNRTGKRYDEEYLQQGDGKIYCCVPSMLRVYSEGENYAARWGLPPTEVGYIDIDIDEKMRINDVKLVVSNREEFRIKDTYQWRQKLAEQI